MRSPADIFQWLARPVVQTAKGYRLSTFRDDAISGVTVAVVAVPQCMAFALLAGVPVEYGLYTAVFQVLISSLFNSSDHVSVGPTNTQSLLIASVAGRLAAPDAGPETFMAIATMLALVKGIMQLGVAAAGLSQLVKYVSLSVILGFATGAQVLIAVGQLPNFLGLPPVPKQFDAGLLDPLARTVVGVGEHGIHLPSVLIGILGLVIILGCRRLSRLIPGPLIAVVVSGVVAYVAHAVLSAPEFNPGDNPRDILVGLLPRGLPPPKLPGWGEVGLDQIEALLVPGLAIAVVGLLEQVAIAKSVASQTGQRIDPRRECFSQGLTNLASSFLQCFPGSASFSRSALNLTSGARTRFSGLFNGVAIGAIFLMFAPLAEYIPKASLAAVLFVAAFGLFDYQKIKRVLRTSRSDAAVAIVTFAATLLLPLEYAIYVGIFLNIALYLRRASQLHMSEMVRTPGGPFQETPVADKQGNQAVKFLQLEGDLFFGVADELQDRLSELQRSGVKVAIIRLRRTQSIDTTVLAVLDEFVADMHARDGYVLFCGVKEEMTETFEQFGLLDRVGRENFFQTTYGVFTSCEAALDRAKQILNYSIDQKEFRESERLRGWAYEI